MSSAMGPFALDEGLVPAPPDGGEAVVRIHKYQYRQDHRGTLPDRRRQGPGIGRFRARRRLGNRRSDPAGIPSTRAAQEPGASCPRASRWISSMCRGWALSRPRWWMPRTHASSWPPRASGARAPSCPTRWRPMPNALPSSRRSGALPPLAMGIAATEDEAGRIPSIPKVAMIFAPDRLFHAVRHTSGGRGLRDRHTHDLDRPPATGRCR